MSAKRVLPKSEPSCSSYMGLFVLVSLLLGFVAQFAHAAETNLLIVPPEYNRGGAVFFVDECLTRGLTNSISIGELRKWATNTIQLYQRKEAELTSTKATPMRYSSVLTADIPDSIQAIQTRIPSYRFSKPMPPSKELDALLAIHTKELGITKEEAELRWRTWHPDTKAPRVGFYRSSEGSIQAMTMNWYLYGIIVGAESFKPDWEQGPWYHRKLADGIYLWHGYK